MFVKLTKAFMNRTNAHDNCITVLCGLMISRCCCKYQRTVNFFNRGEGAVVVQYILD